MSEGIGNIVDVVATAMETPLDLWLVTLTLLLLFLGCLLMAILSSQIKNQVLRYGLVLSLLYFVIAPIWTVIFQAEIPLSTPETQATPMLIFEVVGLFYLVGVAACVYFAPGLRRLLIGLLAFPLWINVNIYWVASVAIGGVWL